MIAKLEWTQSNTQQNIENFRTGVTINNNKNKSPLLQFNNNISYKFTFQQDIDLGQDKQQQK